MILHCGILQRCASLCPPLLDPRHGDDNGVDEKAVATCGAFARRPLLPASTAKLFPFCVGAMSSSLGFSDRESRISLFSALLSCSFFPPSSPRSLLPSRHGLPEPPRIKLRTASPVGRARPPSLHRLADPSLLPRRLRPRTRLPLVRNAAIRYPDEHVRRSRPASQLVLGPPARRTAVQVGPPPHQRRRAHLPPPLRARPGPARLDDGPRRR